MARTDAERIEKLKTIRDDYEDRLGEMAARPRVTYTVDGQNFNFNEYQKMLMGQLADVNALIKELETVNGTGQLTITSIYSGG